MRSPWITRMGFKSKDKCPYKKHTREIWQTEEEAGWLWKQRLQSCSQQTTEAQRMKSSLELLEGAGSRWHLAFRFPASKAGGVYISVSRYPVCGNVLCQPQETNRIGTQVYNWTLKMMTNKTTKIVGWETREEYIRETGIINHYAVMWGSKKMKSKWIRICVFRVCVCFCVHVLFRKDIQTVGKTERGGR